MIVLNKYNRGEGVFGAGEVTGGGVDEDEASEESHLKFWKHDEKYNHMKSNDLTEDLINSSAAVELN